VERKEMSRERTLKGGGAVCYSDIYFSQFLWLLVLIGQTEGRKRDEQWKRNLERGYAHHLESIALSTPTINSSDRSDRWAVRKMLQSGSDINTSVNSFNQFFRSAQQNGAIKR
jgi:hypothetical protein